MAAQDSPLKQLTRLLSRSAGLEAAREGSWHVFLLKVGVREEEAAVIELTKFLVSCLGLNGLQKRLGKCQVLRLALSQGLPSSVAQEPLLKVIFSAFLFLLHLLFWVAEVFLLACIFMRIHLTHRALMAGPPSHCWFPAKPCHS